MVGSRRYWLGAATGTLVADLAGTLISGGVGQMSMVFAAVAVLFLVAAAFSKSDPGDPPNESSDR